jgi:hypothetical protein
MERLEVRLESTTKHGILQMMVQREEVRMSPANADPYDRRPGATESARALDREEEFRHGVLHKSITQGRMARFVDFAEETHREVHLLRWQPSKAPQVRVERGEGFLQAPRKLQSDEEALGHGRLKDSPGAE